MDFSSARVPVEKINYTNKTGDRLKQEGALAGNRIYPREGVKTTLGRAGFGDSY